MYKITIQETKTVNTIAGKEWAKLDTVEVERECPVREGESKTRIKDVMGFTPEIEKQGTVTRDILIQVVDQLDVEAVIKAINNIS